MQKDHIEVVIKGDTVFIYNSNNGDRLIVYMKGSIKHVTCYLEKGELPYRIRNNIKTT